MNMKMFFYSLSLSNTIYQYNVCTQFTYKRVVVQRKEIGLFVLDWKGGVILDNVNTRAAGGAATAYPSEAPEFTPSF